jgi:hypothetical protein
MAQDLDIPIVELIGKSSPYANHGAGINIPTFTQQITQL